MRRRGLNFVAARRKLINRGVIQSKTACNFYTPLLPAFDELSGRHKGSSAMVEDNEVIQTLPYSVRGPGPQSSSSEFLELPNSYRNHAGVKELSINKLKFHEVGFVGREVESEILHSRLQRVVANRATSTSKEVETDECRQETAQRELVLIKGYSGVGKSALANQLEGWINEIQNGLLVRGKFEQTSQRPFSGIAQAFGKVFEEWHDDSNMSQDWPLLEEIGNRLVSELGSELQLLLSLIPELEVVLPEGQDARSISSKEVEDFGAGQERWKYAFRVLANVLCSCFSPLVIVLDDLQWADVASLSAVENLLVDTQNDSSLLIVGSYRSNEVGEEHVLTSVISNLSDKIGFKLTEIELGSISPLDANKVVMALLGVDDPSTTEDLALICHKRTLGNPFFLIEFVTMLEGEGLITFNLGMLKWVWDIQNVEQSTMSTQNVVSLLESRMKKLSSDVQLLLQYAANLGASFDERILQTVWDKHSSSTNCADRSTLQILLANLKEEHFVEQSFGHRYNWVHDKVQEAALSLGRANDSEFQFEMGSILYDHLDVSDMQAYLFDIANLVNKGKRKGNVEFCELNLRAAQKARKLSAFHSAASYAAYGIEILPKDRWSLDHRDLTLSLFCIGAEMELASQNAVQMEEYAEEVFEHGNCSTLELLPLHLTIEYKQLIDLKYAEAAQYCVMVLRELGYAVVRNDALKGVQALSSIIGIVRKARKEKRDYAETLPLMKDETQKAIMRILNRLFYASFLGEKPASLIWSVVRMVQITLKHGISEVAGPAFATMGFLSLAILKDYEMGYFFANSAINLQQKAPSTYSETTTVYLAVTSGLAWAKPWLSMQSTILDVYNKGMKSGNTIYASWALATHSIVLPFHAGKALPSTLAGGAKCVALVEEMKLGDQISVSRTYCQAIANLIGDSNETVLLRGKWFDVEAWNPNEQMAVFADVNKLLLCIFFGEYEQAGEISLKFQSSFERVAPGNCMYQGEVFFRSLAQFIMARKTGKRKFRNPALRRLGKIESWAKKGNPNVQQYYSLLRAEQAALNNKHNEAESMYQEAVVTSARSGYLHIAALANERYADFLINDRKDLEESKYRIEQAIRFYTEWGAHAVARTIRKNATLQQQS